MKVFAIGTAVLGTIMFLLAGFVVAIYHVNEDMQRWDRWNDNDDRQIR